MKLTAASLVALAVVLTTGGTYAATLVVGPSEFQTITNSANFGLLVGPSGLISPADPANGDINNTSFTDIGAGSADVHSYTVFDIFQGTVVPGSTINSLTLTFGVTGGSAGGGPSGTADIGSFATTGTPIGVGNFDASLDFATTATTSVAYSFTGTDTTNGFVGFEFKTTNPGTNLRITNPQLTIDFTPPNTPPTSSITLGVGGTESAFSAGAGGLDLNLVGTVADTESGNNNLSYTWLAGPGNTVVQAGASVGAGANNVNVPNGLTLAEAALAGLSDPSDSVNLHLRATDGSAVNSASNAGNNLLVTYTNALPSATGNNVGNVVNATISDADLTVAASTANFTESVAYQLLDGDGNAILQGDVIAGDLVSGTIGESDSTSLSWTLDQNLIDTILASANPFLNLRINDIEQTAQGAANFRIDLQNAAVPEPASIALWSLVGLGLVGVGIRRYRRRS